MAATILRKFKLSALANLIVLAAATASTAQSLGIEQNRDYLALQPFESIDTSNGNMILTFSDLVLPGNGGRALSFDRVFNNAWRGGPHWRFSVSGLPLHARCGDRPAPPGCTRWFSR